MAKVVWPGFLRYVRTRCHSFAPYRFNGRKGISGGVVFCEGALVRSLARQQQSKSLSSCEADLYALQMVAQESVAFCNFCHRVYTGIGEMRERDVPQILLESDSSSPCNCWSDRIYPNEVDMLKFVWPG